MFSSSFKIRLKKLFAQTIKKTLDDFTPILMEDYENNKYYYVVNNNMNYIYSLDELYEIIKKDMKDPFTTLPITDYKFVRVLICENAHTS